MLKLTTMFLLLSGIASLTYQVVWVRLLGLSLGSTSASISTVLAAFFLGLALGSYLAERITRNRINSLHPYIILELIIGLSGLALLPVLLNLDLLMASMPALSTSIATKFAVTIILLVVPTVCMGATFPVMASILIRQENEVGVRVSQLYSINTAGAVLGAALAGFVFVPNWGLDGAVYIAFAINLAIVLMGLYLSRHVHLPPIEGVECVASPSAHSNLENTQDAPLRGRALIVLFATGFVAIATEVGWTKYLSIFTGTTIYGFAAILTIFLVGIACGSWVIRSYMGRIQRPELWMSFGLVLLGASLLMTRAGFTMIPPLYEAINHFPVAPWLRHGVKYVFVFVLLFPPTFLFGALFPLNLKLYCGSLQGMRARIGKAYAVNTLASIFGSLAAGFWLIPDFGTDNLLTSMALVLLVLPFIFFPVLSGTTARVGFTVVASLAIVCNWLLPHLSFEALITSVQYDDKSYKGDKPEYLFLKEGKAGVVSMVTFDGRHVKLQNNGLNESFIDLEDENDVLLVESLLGLVPYMLHENPKSAFVVGFGGGTTTGSLTLTKLESIRVVELEPAVVEAGRAIFGGEIPALQDPRVKLDFNDARNTLLVEDTSYDIIAAQPSHPWLARAANVFTKDFFTLVRSRLNDGGIYGQWVNLFHMDATTLKSLLKAFYQVFPYGMTFANLDSGDLVMFGSNRAVVFDYTRIESRLNEPRIKQVMSYHHIHGARDLMWYFALSRDQALAAAGDVEPNTDTNILSEVRLSAIDYKASAEEDPYDFLHDNYSFNVSPYFAEDAVQRVYDLGTYYLREWGEDVMAQYAANQLLEAAPEKARGIEYEKLWLRFDYDQAFDLYAQHEDWPDRTREQQALALNTEGRGDEAFAVMKKIGDKRSRQELHARLLYEQQKFDELSALKVQGDAGRMWQLTALARTQPIAAGEEMTEIVERVPPLLPQLRVLAAYYGYINDKNQLDRYARRIVKFEDKEIKRIRKLLEQAIKNDKLERAQRLLKYIDDFNPEDDYEVDRLRRKLAKIREEVESVESGEVSHG